MADLGPSDVNVTLPPQDVDFQGVQKVSYPSIAFGGAGKTYGSTNGITMPDKSAFGMKKEIKRVHLSPPGDGYVYVWDRVNHKLRIFTGNYSEATDGPLVEVDSSFAPAAVVLDLTVIGT